MSRNTVETVIVCLLFYMVAGYIVINILSIESDLFEKDFRNQVDDVTGALHHLAWLAVWPVALLYVVYRKVIRVAERKNNQ